MQIGQQFRSDRLMQLFIQCEERQKERGEVQALFLIGNKSLACFALERRKNTRFMFFVVCQRIISGLLFFMSSKNPTFQLFATTIWSQARLVLGNRIFIHCAQRGCGEYQSKVSLSKISTSVSLDIFPAPKLIYEKKETF